MASCGRHEVFGQNVAGNKLEAARSQGDFYLYADYTLAGETKSLLLGKFGYCASKDKGTLKLNNPGCVLSLVSKETKSWKN